MCGPQTKSLERHNACTVKENEVQGEAVPRIQSLAFSQQLSAAKDEVRKLEKEEADFHNLVDYDASRGTSPGPGLNENQALIRWKRHAVAVECFQLMGTFLIQAENPPPDPPKGWQLSKLAAMEICEDYLTHSWSAYKPFRLAGAEVARICFSLDFGHS
jgi:hypothetical protein